MAGNKYEYAKERGGTTHAKGGNILRTIGHGILRNAFVKLGGLLNPIERPDASLFGILK